MGILLFGCALTILWILMIVDCVKNEPSEGNDKRTWALIIIFTYFIGALVYLFVRRPERIKKYGG